MVEGYNQATGQWIGRTAQNKTLNFTMRSGPAANRCSGHICRFG